MAYTGISDIKYQELYSYTAVVVVVVLLILLGWLYLPDGRFTYRSSVQKIQLQYKLRQYLADSLADNANMAHKLGS